MTAAYTYRGTKKVDSVDCAVFGEEDKWVDHLVYFKKDTWVPVAVYDKQQKIEGVTGGLTHYSDCKEGRDAAASFAPVRWGTN